MKMTRDGILIGLLALSAPLACTNSKPGGDEAKVKVFGAAIESASDARPFSEVLAEPDRFAGMESVVVDGHVRRVCQAKGCWMELAAGDEADAAGARITFKDYGFFVPTDSAGSHARVQGEVLLHRLEPGEVAHMEAEGATVPNKAADGSAREVRIVARGVELRDRS